MNTETGKFVDSTLLHKDFENEVRTDGKKKYKRFDLGEVIRVKDEDFVLQAVTDDCLILVPWAKVKAMQSKGV